MKDTDVTVKQREDGSYYIKGGKSALAILQDYGVALPANCGGRGSCGKCRIIVKGDNVPATAEDEKIFDKRELEEGWRLACRLFPAQGFAVFVPEQTKKAESGYKAVDGFALAGESGIGGNGGQDGTSEENGGGNGENSGDNGKRAGRKTGAAVDIGTTTLAFSLADLESGEVIASCSAMNPQRRHGADVLSRIAAAEQGMAEAMKEEIIAAVAEGLERLYRMAQETVPDRIAAAGNTVMLHLLRGYDVSELGRIPFRPVTLEEERLDAEEMFGEFRPAWLPEQTPVCLLPGISAFVGADITAGLYCCGFFERSDRAFLLDLGTNGEMGLLADGVLYTASTAAGPAFEGGNIGCGVGSIEGAVSDIVLMRKESGELVKKVTTIGGKKPAGLCGTGLIALVSELKKQGLMDEMGLLDDEYFDCGFPFAGDGEDSFVLTQKDIRELQLAKGAIRAGISILLSKAGLTAAQVDQVYLAGGFGFFLDTEKAMDICLLPGDFEGRISAAGNSCIGGLIRYLVRGREELARVFDRARIVEVNLAAEPDFYERYTDAMAFEEDM